MFKYELLRNNDNGDDDDDDYEHNK